jgi:hypothetical protein
MNENMKITIFGSVFGFLLYWTIATAVFLYNNPTANSMAGVREFKDVMSFRKLERYQPPNNPK